MQGLLHILKELIMCNIYRRFVFIYIKIKFNVNELFIKNFFQKIRAFFIEIFKNNWADTLFESISHM